MLENVLSKQNILLSFQAKYLSENVFSNRQMTRRIILLSENVFSNKQLLLVYASWCWRTYFQQAITGLHTVFVQAVTRGVFGGKLLWSTRIF